MQRFGVLSCLLYLKCSLVERQFILYTLGGLAVSRSIGDHSMRSIGVIPEPVITTHTVRPGTDAFLILASDGIWEFGAQ